MNRLARFSLVALAPLLAFFVSCSESDRIPVRMATLFSKEHHLAKKLEWTAAELEKRSQGRFECQVFAGSVMGGEKENLEDLLLGSLELMNGAGSYYYRYVPEASVLELPFYDWKDRHEAHRVIRAYWPRLMAASEAKGFYPVALDSRDYWGVYYREPIDSLDRVRNAKFRAVNADLWIEATKLYGAIPNPMPYADAYMAFKTGVADGTLNSVAGGVAGNWHEVLKCFLDTRLVLSESFTVASKQWVEGLPEDLRKIFLDVCLESEQFNLKEVERQFIANRKKMEKAGVHWVDHEKIDLGDLREKGLEFRENYMKARGLEVYAFYLDWLEHIERETGRAPK